MSKIILEIEDGKDSEVEISMHVLMVFLMMPVELAIPEKSRQEAMKNFLEKAFYEILVPYEGLPKYKD